MRSIAPPPLDFDVLLSLFSFVALYYSSFLAHLTPLTRKFLLALMFTTPLPAFFCLPTTTCAGTNLVGTTCAEYTVGGVPLEGGAGTVSMDGTTITGCTIAANSDYGTDVSVIVTHNGVSNSVGIPTFTVDPELNNASTEARESA